MAISGNIQINIGLPNESTNSDSLYTAFNKINDNFNTLFGNANNVVAGNGIKITNNPATGVSVANTVISANLIAGNNIVLTVANTGAITIDAIGGGGNGGNITGVLAGTGLSGGGYSGNVTLSLGSSNVTAGNYVNPTITVDQYGRITSAANNNSFGTVTSVRLVGGSGIGIGGDNPITTSGNITVTNTGVTGITAGPGITLTGGPTGNITIGVAGGGVGTGTVTSVGINSNTGLIISGSPIISAGNISVNLPNNLVVPGNITANGSFIGNGSGITNITVAAGDVTGLGNIATYNLDGNSSNVLHGDGTWSADQTNYSNSNVAAYLPTYTGNLKGGNANLGNAAVANYFIGNFYGAANTATSATTAGTVTTAAQPNITSVGTLSSLTVTGNISSGNANLGNSVTANYFTGNGYYLTGLNPSNVIANTANFAAYAGNVTVAGQSNITSLGTLTSLDVSGNITAPNITANTGIFSGNGSGLSSLTGANVTGAVSFATTANSVAGANVTGAVSSATTAGTVTTAAQPNITSLGSLTGLTLSANSDITMSGTGSQLSGANLVSATYLTGTLTTGSQPNITSVGTLSSVTITGNASANNFIATNIVKTTPVAFATLPSAGTAGAGARAFINDGNLAASTNFGAQVTGGAGNNVPVYSDGTNWRIG